MCLNFNLLQRVGMLMGFWGIGSAQYRIDHSRLTHYVHAVRPIAKDEEITITCEYLSQLAYVFFIFILLLTHKPRQ